ncbi:MAG TPA: cupredoxin domain-containing protein, partial [Candidatus Sulfotelmatobacter sp.]|nr:cupredoxin domain-containing protein [Candidatus Sulfotelmatobacter sp.]
RDGAAVRGLFKKFNNVLALYGHIHQLTKTQVDNITFYSARGTMYPLPAPGSVPKKAPVAWNAAAPYKELGFRRIDVKTNPAGYVLTEYNIFGTPETATAPAIKITAKRFEFSPNKIMLKKGELTELDLTSEDVEHGFNCPDLGIRADVMPGSVTVLKVSPIKTGTFSFFCDVYCGEGHGGMNGTITVK